MTPSAQGIADKFLRIFIPLSGAIGFIVGYIFQTFSITLVFVGFAVIVSLAIVIPNWPFMYPSVDEDPELTAGFVDEEKVSAYIAMVEGREMDGNKKKR